MSSKRLLLVVALVLGLAIAAGWRLTHAGGVMRVTVIDVGQADSILVEPAM